MKNGKFFKVCPKSKLIVGINNKYFNYKWLILTLGFFSLLWYLIRVIPKPSRASYPCMQAAAPFAFTFIAFTSTLFLSAFGIRKAFHYFKTNRFAVAFLFSGIAIIGMLANVLFVDKNTFGIDAKISTGTFTPIDKPNSPMGVAGGIFPGRVSWVHDPAATNWDGQSEYWWDSVNTNQKAVSGMMISVINNISGGSTISESWDILFKNLNKKKSKGNVGYKVGEQIVIKINLNSRGTSNWLDASPQTVYALLDELVNTVGIAQADICIYDAIRDNGMSAVENHCKKDFPKVLYQNWGTWVPNKINYSSLEVKGQDCRSIPSKVVEADYMINLALLKRHCQYSDDWTEEDGLTAVTMCGKTHFGSIKAPWELHEVLQDWRRGMGTYNPVVDMMGSQYFSGNTVVYLIDALYASSMHETLPIKWKMQPFNNDWPSSIFASTDLVAIESVGLDFLNAEWGLVANADNYLHEAANANNPPSKTKYQPDNVPLPSLGVHEHWNNSLDKKYSKNLGKKEGIELVLIENR